MEWIVWDDTLETGHAELDDDHKRLVDLINQLADGVTNHKGMEFCGKAFEALIEHTQRHFALEERLMAAHRYSRSEHHKAQHAALFAEVRELTSTFDQPGLASPLSVSLLQFLEVWLKHHILGSDKELADAISTVR